MKSAVKLFLIFLVSLGIVSAASTDSRSEESEEAFQDDQEIKSNNSSSPSTSLISTSIPMEMGPLDSHEAMNNREMPTKMREKRSYEFLMGLINNNSRYEVTKVDPSIAKEKPERLGKTQTAQEPTELETEDEDDDEDEDNNVVASELLLELMVRIAAHPDQWDEVHELLQKIDEDLTVTEDILGKLNSRNHHKNPHTIRPNVETNSIEKKLAKVETTREPQRTTTFITTQRSTTQNSKATVRNSINSWPTFDKYQSSVTFVNSNNISVENKNVEATTQKYQDSLEKLSQSTTYPKNFAYHRVTGTPFNMNKNPKAYIAVSVIAPKPVSGLPTDNDTNLENELHQLKPWSHFQNLKNMQSIRSKWVIQSDTEESNKTTL